MWLNNCSSYKKLSIFRETISSVNGCYCIDYFHVAGHSFKLQFDYCVNFIGSGQGCLGMPKVSEIMNI